METKHVGVESEASRSIAGCSDSARGVSDHSVGGVATGGNQTDPLIAMIERAARDPSVDVDKMERLFQMHERAQALRARMEYDSSFAEMQPELPEIDKKGKIVIKEKGTEKIIQSTPYALWEDTNRLIKPTLAKYGFGLSFRIAQTESRLTATAVLSHRSGHREETSFSAPIDQTGSKNNVQGWGSSLTYSKRYAGTAILNITTKGEDDDGRAAGAGDVVTEQQAQTIVDAITAKGKTLEGFCKLFKIERIDNLPASRFDDAMVAIRGRAKVLT